MGFEALNKGFLITGNILFDSGETIDVGEYITSIMVRKRYLKDAFPLYVIDMQITDVMRNQIRDNECKLALRISQYTINELSSNEEENGVTEENIIFDDQIRIYEKPFTTTASKTDDVDDGEEDESSPNKNIISVPYRISGIPESLISVNNTVVNTIYTDTKLINPMVNILSEFNKPIFIQEPTNNEHLRNILIPPMSPVNAVHFLNDTYEFYRDGLSLFIDNNKILLYSPLGDLNYENSFNINIKSIEKTAGILETSQIMYDKDEKIFKFSFTAPPSFFNRKKILFDGIGSTTVFYSYDDNFNLNKRTTLQDEGFNKTRYFWNTNGRKSVEDSLLNTKSISFSITTGNFNPNMISPLTSFNVSSDYNDINGKYILDSLSYIFIKRSINQFKCVMNIELVKK